LEIGLFLGGILFYDFYDIDLEFNSYDFTLKLEEVSTFDINFSKLSQSTIA